MPGSRSKLREELKELIEIPLRHPELYSDLSIQAPKAVILYGVTGSGKTYLIKQAAENANARLVPINLDSIKATNLVEIVNIECKMDKPIVFYLVMHNPEAIEKDVINTLAKILDGDYSLDLTQVVFASSSVRPILPSELTRPGRFDQELYVGLPDNEDRLSILNNLLTDTKLASDIDLSSLSNKTRGFTPADLIQLVKTAARFAIRRYSKEEQLNGSELKPGTTVISQVDFKLAIKEIEPTVYKEFGLIQPPVKWESIAGYDELKSIIQEKIIEPLQYKEYFDQVESSGAKGILLYGPPGNGKTTLAKGIANAIKGHFLYINSSDLLGNSGNKQLSQLFQVAREVQPTVLFFDEADSFLVNREKAKKETIGLVNEFLTLMDGSNSTDKPLVIAATNYIDKIDEAAIRPGRLELKLRISPPGLTEREAIFRSFCKSLNLADDVDCTELANLTEPREGSQYSIADLLLIVREAGIRGAQEAISQNLDPTDVVIKMKYFEETIQKTPPSNKIVNPDKEDNLKFLLDQLKNLDETQRTQILKEIQNYS